MAYHAIILMGAATLLNGEAFGNHWQKLWSEAEKRGVFEYPYFRLNLALLGYFCGEVEPYNTWLLDERSRRWEAADLLTFVRRDHSEELNALLVRIMRGDLPTPSECLYLVRPASTLGFAINYIARNTRMARHFSHPTQILMVLNWAEIAADLYAEWKRDGLFGLRDRAVIERAFEKLERTQVMEKNRFFGVAEALPPGRLRTRLFELWDKTYR